MEQREFFRRTRIAPAKWRLTPWGDEGGGFWAVAIHRDRVLWYNDIEDGFNVSRFDEHGQIPRNEYWCNEDSLRWALPRLQGEPGTQLGPPGPVADAQDGPSQGLSTMLRRRRTGR
jgi:hypothetical protein